MHITQCFSAALAVLPLIMASPLAIDHQVSERLTARSEPGASVPVTAEASVTATSSQPQAQVPSGETVARVSSGAGAAAAVQVPGEVALWGTKEAGKGEQLRVRTLRATDAVLVAQGKSSERQGRMQRRKPHKVATYLDMSGGGEGDEQTESRRKAALAEFIDTANKNLHRPFKITFVVPTDITVYSAVDQANKQLKGLHMEVEQMHPPKTAVGRSVKVDDDKVLI